MIELKCVDFPKGVIQHAVFFYVRYVSYRELEEMLAERGVGVDHANLSRWVAKFASLITDRRHARKRRMAKSCRVYDTYFEVKGQWSALYWAVDRGGQTLDEFK